MKINNWKEYKLGELFEIHTTKDENSTDSINGNTPYISSTQLNNGVSSFIADEPSQEKNTITVARNGSVGTSFFHAYEYCASPDDIRVFKPKFKINKYIGIFLTVLIEKEKYRYAYGRKFGTKRMEKTIIKLPALTNGLPDWQWVENHVKDVLIPQLPNYAKAVWTDTYNTAPVNKNKLPLETEKWKWFQYNEVFEIEKGVRLTNFDMEEGSVPYIASGSFNNGIVSYVGNGVTHKKGCITFACYGSIGECFYHDYNIWASDNVNVISLKYRGINKYIGLFLISLFNLEKYRFSYGLTAKVSRLNNFKIKLPITTDDIPDWQFMENYIKSLPYSANL
ncbi:MAG: restriction endonuclease subunit S [Nitrospirota bacterium]